MVCVVEAADVALVLADAADVADPLAAAVPLAAVPLVALAEALVALCDVVVEEVELVVELVLVAEALSDWPGTICMVDAEEPPEDSGSLSRPNPFVAMPETTKAAATIPPKMAGALRDGGCVLIWRTERYSN